MKDVAASSFRLNYVTEKSTNKIDWGEYQSPAKHNRHVKFQSQEFYLQNYQMTK